MTLIVGIIFILISFLPKWENKVYSRSIIAIVSLVVCSLPFINYSIQGFDKLNGSLWIAPAISIYYLLKVVSKDSGLKDIRNLGVNYILIDLLNFNLISSYYVHAIVLLLILLIYSNLFDKWSRMSIYCLIIINSIFKLYIGYYGNVENEPNYILSDIILYFETIRYALYLILTLWATFKAVSMKNLNYFSLVWPYLAFKSVTSSGVTLEPTSIVTFTLVLFLAALLISKRNIDVVLFILTFLFSLQLGEKVYWYLNAFVVVKMILNYLDNHRIETLSFKVPKDIIKHILLFLPVLAFILLKSWELQLITLMAVILIGNNIVRYSHD